MAAAAIIIHSPSPSLPYHPLQQHIPTGGSKFIYNHKFNYTNKLLPSLLHSNQHHHSHLPPPIHASAHQDNDEDEEEASDVTASFSRRRPHFLEFDNGNGTKSPPSPTTTFNTNKLKTDDNDDGGGLNLEELEDGFLRKPRRKKKNESMNRSSIIAKQVITIQSAITLGFVSQLWLDTSSWLVLVIELRPNLLSGQAYRFLLHDILQVGDVVLIQDESLTENEIKMVGLETLVGYNVITPARQNIGKVRGYTFNVNSGAVVSLELDSFGISIIPSSLVSTYALFVEDVLEVVSDTVIVHEAAASRIQRLTKGFWDAKKAMKSIDEFGEYADQENPVQPDYSWRRRRRSSSENLQSEVGEEMDVDWELPMDYL